MTKIKQAYRDLNTPQRVAVGLALVAGVAAYKFSLAYLAVTFLFG